MILELRFAERMFLRAAGSSSARAFGHAHGSQRVLGLLLVVSCAFSGGCTTLRVVRYNFPEIDNYNLFANRDVSRASQPYRFKYRSDQRRTLEGLRIRTPKQGEVSLEEFLNSSKTVAFVVIKDDAIVYEKYFRGRKEDTLVNSFSITKSFVSALVGIAISEGYIKSPDQTVAELLPEFRGKPYGPVSVRDLLQMTSGIGFSFNGFSPFADNAQFYYGSDLRKQTADLRAREQPGKVWKYKESDPQMLVLILERVTGRSVSKYLEEKIWQPMGAEFDASWSLDSAEHGEEKAFAGFNGRARDFAKFGLVYLHRGRGNGRQIVPEKWVRDSTVPDTRNGGAENHKYFWWLPRPPEDDYFANGNLGQFIYVNPKSRVVIVKLSEANKPGMTKAFRQITHSLDR